MKNTATKIVEKLQKADFESYFAGGCVRDMILKKDHIDIDIATSARPEEIENLFKKTFPIGKSFGVILIKENDHHFEIATFRSDSGSSDGRRPDAVFFTDAQEDALRRDFTINGIFWDPIKKEFHDFVHGRSDLRRGILRFIGEPEKRIKEDFLRILRAIRFKNRFDLEYEKETQQALKKHASLTTQVSAERIQDELTKILRHPSSREAFKDLRDLKILEKIIPELADLEHVPQDKVYHGEGNALNHTILCLSKIDNKSEDEVFWAVLFHDLGKVQTVKYCCGRIHFFGHQDIGETIVLKILKRLKFSRKKRDNITWLVKNHHIFDQFNQMRLVKKFKYFDHTQFENLCAVHRADILGSIPYDYKTRETALKELSIIEENFRFARSEQILPSQKKELLTGKEIIEFCNITQSLVFFFFFTFYKNLFFHHKGEGGLKL